MYEIRYREEDEMILSENLKLGKRPNNWDIVGLNKLFFIKAGGDLKTKFFSERKTDIHKYPIYTNNTTPDNIYGYTSKPVFKGDSITVTGRGDIGIAFYREEEFDAIIRLLVLTPKNKIICKYYTYFINSKLDFNVGSSAINQLSAQQIAPYKVFIPQIIEQEKIANFLDLKTTKFDSIISKKEDLIKKLEEAKKSLISEVVTGKVKILDGELVEREADEMKDSGVEWLGMIAKDWEVKMIKRLTTIGRGASPRPIDDPKFFDDNGEYSWTRISDVTASDKYLKATEQKMSKLGASLSVKLEIDKLFLSIAGSVGKPCITKIKTCIHDGFVYFPDLTDELIEYLYYVFMGAQCYKGLGKLGTQLNLNRETVGSIYIAISCDDQEIKNINNYLNNSLERFSKIISKNKLQIEKLKQAKQSLISEAVTGKIDLRDWEIQEI